MKLWIDECLTPTLVEQANRRGYWAACNRDRGLLGCPDSELHPIVVGEDAVFVTNNESDFVALCRGVDLHTGLVTLPQANRRADQWAPFHAALDHIEQRAAAAGEPARDWMVNTHVQVGAGGDVTHGDLP